MRSLIDAFPFFNELDLLEVRMNELKDVVDKFVILEAGETYGGSLKPYHLSAAWDRFAPFHHKMIYIRLMRLEPKCEDRTTGRRRERMQRDAMMPHIQRACSSREDVVSFGDLDEIPRASALCALKATLPPGTIVRLKQKSFYYNTSTVVDYGHDFASRARVGTFGAMLDCGGPYNFRMYQKYICAAIENAGWHFSYFGGPDKIEAKVASMAPYLAEYKLYGREELERDVRMGLDLHHRRCEMPSLFKHVDPLEDVPEFLRDNRERFPHFFRGQQ